jgi:hypothetical protein
MKSVLILVAAAFLAACTSKKSETTAVTDSVRVDSAVLADVPAAATLAYSPLNGFTVRNTLGMSDSINFFLLTGQKEVDKMFITDPSMNSEMSRPDFLINFNIAVVCLPRMEQTLINLEKVEVGESTINIYVKVERGEKQKFASKPAQLFAIERRDGYGALQFYVNGKESKVIPLMVN